MAGIERKSFSAADEVRQPDKARVEVVDLGGAKAARMVCQPGWKWSESIKPIVGGDTCQARHVGTIVSGTLHVSHADGTQVDLGAGDAYIIEPGHDAWVVGEEPAVAFEFESTTAAAFGKGTA